MEVPQLRGGGNRTRVRSRTGNAMEQAPASGLTRCRLADARCLPSAHPAPKRGAAAGFSLAAVEGTSRQLVMGEDACRVQTASCG